jgi:hypothetical protein
MDAVERLIKSALLLAFSLLNVIDMVQTTAFLRMGIEGNPFAVHYPLLWFAFKASFALGLPVGLSLLDSYLDDKDDEGFYAFLEQVASALYVVIFVADIFFFLQVSKNTAVLGRVLP